MEHPLRPAAVGARAAARHTGAGARAARAAAAGGRSRCAPRALGARPYLRCTRAGARGSPWRVAQPQVDLDLQPANSPGPCVLGSQDAPAGAGAPLARAHAHPHRAAPCPSPSPRTRAASPEPRPPSRAASPAAGFTGHDAIAAADQQPPPRSLAGAVAAASAAAAAAGAAAAVAAAEAPPANTAPAAPAPAAKGPSNLTLRVASGVLLGGAAAAVIVNGGALFLTAALAIVYQATKEYFGLVTARGVTRGDEPPPPLVAASTTVACLCVAAAAFLVGKKGGALLCVFAFALAALNLVAVPRPSFGGLSSTVFGLFYCGYLPSFWIKLRGLAMLAPPIALLPGCPQPSVGLLATFVAVACIVAADTGAYFVGRSLGRTKLTDISPKKTVEGAAGGLASAVAAALGLQAAVGWPGSAAAAAGYGVVTFCASIFGDLIESVMKRDAGMKDSGNLIPGHGGLLDRFDSYMFTGAIAWAYVTVLLPRFGLV